MGSEKLSEETIPIKKAIRIIAVTWILSMVTALAIFYFLPNLFPRTWHEVARFSGTDTRPTDFFIIPSDNWRISWHVSGNPLTETTSFWFWVHNDKTILPVFDLGTLTEVDFEAAFFSTPSGVEYITGSGRFQIEVLVENVAWEIIVEAYY